MSRRTRLGTLASGAMVVALVLAACNQGGASKGTVEELLKPENKAKLTAILTYHVVPGKVMAADVVKVNEAKTVQWGSIKVHAGGGKVTVDNAGVVKTDIGASNGVIHVIDTVLMPK